MDVSQHELVPEHEILDDEDVETVLDEYDTRRTDLPKIEASDPALPAEAEVDDVVRITRDSRTTDDAVVYRLVVK
jgi:DNA-directed RNA polymerase subunit H